MNTNLEKWTPILEMANCPKERIEKLSQFCEDFSQRESELNINSDVALKSLLPFNIKFLSSLKIEDESNFVYLGKDINSYETCSINKKLSIDTDITGVDLIKTTETELFDELLNNIQTTIDETKKFSFGSIVIKSLSLISEKTFAPCLYLTYNLYKGEYQV